MSVEAKKWYQGAELYLNFFQNLTFEMELLRLACSPGAFGGRGVHIHSLVGQGSLSRHACLKSEFAERCLLRSHSHSHFVMARML